MSGIDETAPTSDFGPGVSPAPDTAAIAEAPGATIGAYRLVERIGEGGFGTVFLAQQDAPVRRTVALKVIKLGMDTRQVVARFEQERQALALMDHPHIAKVLDAGATATGRPYFVMELCRGEPITQYCDAHRLSIPQRLALFRQVCAAVQHAHLKGVIHRDLKPSNILVSTEEGEPFVRVIDFGIAKATSARLGDRPLLTAESQLVGTPEYMSPEQAAGSADIDTRSDVYSLGVLLYALLAGSTPIDSSQIRTRSFGELQRLIRDSDPAPPSVRVGESAEALKVHAAQRSCEATRLVSALRGELDWIVLRALEKDPARRYATVKDLADDVGRHVSGLPVTAAPPSAAYRWRKTFARHRTAAIAGVLVLLAVAAGSGLAVAGLVKARDEAHAADGARVETERIVGFLSDMLATVEPGELGRDVSMRAVLDAAAGTISSRFGDMPIAESRLRLTIGNAYAALGDLASADDHIGVAAELRRRELGPRDPLTLTTLANLAGLRQRQGRLAESERLAREILDGETPPSFATELIGVRNNLAQTLVRQGHLPEALELQRGVVEDYRRTLGPRHRHTLGATVNLATMLEAAGNVSEAEAMLAKVAADAKEALGANAPETLFFESQLASIYQGLQRWPDAARLFADVFERQSQVLGAAHPEAARTETNLGTVLGKIATTDAERSAARGHLLRAYRSLRDALGARHHDTLTTAINLLDFDESVGWPPEDSHAEIPRVELVRTLAYVGEAEAARSELLNTAAWYLLTVEPEALRDSATAERIARRACDQARRNGEAALWSYLDTLALAQWRNGSPLDAAASQREALSLLPASDESFRGEMQGRLSEYLKVDGPPPK
ncbi:MAG: serine/threonine protein kinase [Phycisphaerae bacterium]|nr:serine/threonine protein kinase [Phycisphaerae bacterium]